tara:strand:+ start:2289 stop:2909 length:621 start_codon:yes stop_codon:yes gene_type:complete
MSNLTINTKDQFDFSFSKEAEKKILEILKKYPPERKASAVMPLLDLAQREAGGWLPISALEAVAEKVGLAYMRVLEIASFYTMYNLNPVGKWHLQICGTTPCWLRGSDGILKAIYDTLKIKPNETSKNGEFTLTPVECLGACVNAPILQVNDDFYEDLNYSSTKKLIEGLKKDKKPNYGSIKDRKSEPENGATVLLSIKGKVNASR